MCIATPSSAAGRKGNWFFSYHSHRILPDDSQSNLCTFDFDSDVTGRHTCVKRNNASSVLPRGSVYCIIWSWYYACTRRYISCKLHLGILYIYYVHTILYEWHPDSRHDETEGGEIILGPWNLTLVNFFELKKQLKIRIWRTQRKN